MINPTVRPVRGPRSPSYGIFPALADADDLGRDLGALLHVSDVIPQLIGDQLFTGVGALILSASGEMPLDLINLGLQLVPVIK